MAEEGRPDRQRWSDPLASASLPAGLPSWPDGCGASDRAAAEAAGGASQLAAAEESGGRRRGARLRSGKRPGGRTGPASPWRLAALVAASIALLALAGFGRLPGLAGGSAGGGLGSSSGSGEPAWADRSLDPKRLTIGYVKDSPRVLLREDEALRQAAAAAGVKLAWREYADSSALVRAVQSGEADFGEADDAALASLHEAGDGLRALAAEPSNPQAYAIVAREGSEPGDVAWLRGRTIGYVPRSNSHALLLQALRQAGLSEAEVELRPLSPAELIRSFRKGSLDAWAAQEPELTRLESLDDRVLADGQAIAGAVGLRELLLTTAENEASRGELLEAVVWAYGMQDEYLLRDYHDAAERLSEQTDVTHLQWLRLFERKSFGTAPLLPGIQAEEQRLADALAELGLRASPIDMTELLRAPE